MNSYQVYRAARKTLPYIDHILTDRLKSQSIVDSSLTQALFGDLKRNLSKDMIYSKHRKMSNDHTEKRFRGQNNKDITIVKHFSMFAG